tara:strand:- start:121 stop:321 length:201 start_codon:yes stop_codon:yes gene_type:complete
MGHYSELSESYQADIDRIIDSILALPDPTDEQRKNADVVGDPVWQILACAHEDIVHIGVVRERAKI